MIRGKSLVALGINNTRAVTDCPRIYRDKDNTIEITSDCAHAEMVILSKYRPGDVFLVVRYARNGELTMAKPCKFCTKYLKRNNVNTVWYTDWDGSFKRINIKSS